MHSSAVPPQFGPSPAACQFSTIQPACKKASSSPTRGPRTPHKPGPSPAACQFSTIQPDDSAIQTQKLGSFCKEHVCPQPRARAPRPNPAPARQKPGVPQPDWPILKSKPRNWVRFPNMHSNAGPPQLGAASAERRLSTISFCKEPCSPPSAGLTHRSDTIRNHP